MGNIGLVLLVDDNDTDNFINKRLMEIFNFAKFVMVKSSGSEALEFLKANEDNIGNMPDLIFLDINMPVIDGFLFLDEYEKLSKLHKKCKIVIISGHYNFYYVSKLINNKHVIGYYTKPLSDIYMVDIKKKLNELSVHIL